MRSNRRKITALVASCATVAATAVTGLSVAAPAEAGPVSPVAITATPSNGNAGTTFNVDTTVTNTTGGNVDATAIVDVPAGANLTGASAPAPWTLTYSTDNGSTWGGAPADLADVTNVRSVASPMPASSSATPLSPMQMTGALTVSGAGDGYNATFYKGRLWLANHHARAGDPTYGDWLKCFDKETGAVCPDVGGGTGATYISATSGDPFGKGAESFDTANISYTYIDQTNGHIYVPVQETSASLPSKVGWVCGDLDTFTSCGFLDAGTEEAPQDFGGVSLFTRFTPAPPNATNFSSLYAVGGSGKIYCLDAASGALCGNSGTKTMTNPLVMPDIGHMILTSSAGIARGDSAAKYVFSTSPTSATNADLQCSITGGAGGCFAPIVLDGTATFPGATGVSWSQPIPVYTPAGDLDGVCVGGNGGYTEPVWKCFTVAGAALPAWETTMLSVSPTPKGHFGGRVTDPANLGYGWSLAMTTLNVGTKTYIPWVTYPDATLTTAVNSTTCFDFSTGAACAGFTPPSGPYEGNKLYTNAPDDVNPNCLWWSGNDGHLISYDAITGIPGCGAVGRTTATATPPTCSPYDTTHYTNFAIPNLPGGTSALVRFYDNQGNMYKVGGVADHTIADSSKTVDLSSVPASGATSQLTAQIWVTSPGIVPMTDVSGVIGWDASTPAVCAQMVVTNECEATASLPLDAHVTLVPAGGGANVTGNASTGFAVNRAAQDCTVALTKKINGKPEPTTPGYTTGSGAPIPYTFEVSTPGVFSLGTPDLLDNNATPSNPADDFHPTYVSGDTNKNNRLDPGETWLYTYTGTALAGVHTNTATVTAPGATNNPQTAQAVYTAMDNGIAIVKKTNDKTTIETLIPGDPVGWTYAVTNTGPQTLTDVTVTDSIEGAATCPKTTLASGETMTCTISGVVKLGAYANTGTATGKDPQGATVTAQSNSGYDGADPAVNIIKTINDAGNLDLPDAHRYETTPQAVLSYKFTVQNAGSVPLIDVNVTDVPNAPNPDTIMVDCPKSTLAVAEIMVCSGSGAAREGTFDDAGVVSGTPANTDGTPLTHIDGTPVANVEAVSYAGYVAQATPVPTPTPTQTETPAPNPTAPPTPTPSPTDNRPAPIATYVDPAALSSTNDGAVPSTSYPDTTLAQTGGNGNLLIIGLAGVLLILAGSASVVIFRRNN